MDGGKYGKNADRRVNLLPEILIHLPESETKVPHGRKMAQQSIFIASDNCSHGVGCLLDIHGFLICMTVTPKKFLLHPP